MNIKTKLIISVLLPIISACSTQPVVDMPSEQVDSEVSVTPIPAKNTSRISAMTRVKAGKTLKLVRIMEGGACNKNQQGVMGVFSVYANPEDIIRIKQQQGSAVFANFQSLIETFSMRALQQAVDSMNFQNVIATQNDNEIQKPLGNKFAALFFDSIASDISEFEANTTLMIDVISQPDSLTIYQNNCKTLHDH